MFFAKSLSFVHRQPARSNCKGLTRTETIWVFILVAVCAFAILGSLRSDEAGRNLREAQDELQYLAGQVRFALEVDPLHGEAWPPLMISEGTSPSGLAATESLSRALGSELFLPSDPWGSAYVCEKRAPGQWDLWSAGPAAQAIREADKLARAREQGLLIELRLPPALTQSD